MSPSKVPETDLANLGKTKDIIQSRYFIENMTPLLVQTSWAQMLAPILKEASRCAEGQAIV